MCTLLTGCSNEARRNSDDGPFWNYTVVLAKPPCHRDSFEKGPLCPQC